MGRKRDFIFARERLDSAEAEYRRHHNLLLKMDRAFWGKDFASKRAGERAWQHLIALSDKTPKLARAVCQALIDYADAYMIYRPTEEEEPKAMREHREAWDNLSYEHRRQWKLRLADLDNRREKLKKRLEQEKKEIDDELGF